MRPSVSHALIAVLLIAFLLPPLYVASVGPAIWCRDRGIISQPMLMTVYGPVGKLFDVRFVGRHIHWYCSLWHNRELAQQNGQFTPTQP